MSRLPRLLYLANPPVFDSTGGAGLLYRLFEDYPANDLELAWLSHDPSGGTYQYLPRVRHHLMPLPQWLVRSGSQRLSTCFALSYSLCSSYWVNRILRELGSFAPEAIVSVTHGLLWDTAGKLADKLKVPCHLIHHDHWRVTVPVPKYLSAWAGRRWARACRRAKNNLCVSVGMLDEVRRTGASQASLLYPSSSRGAFDVVPSGLRESRGGLVFGYAGTLQTAGHLALVRRFAAIVTARGHTMRFFTPYDEQFWRDNLGEHYREGMVAGFLSGRDVPTALRAEVDALFLPLSFDPGDGENMRVSFPCKLCDYTASGRPIVAWLPPHSAAARWAEGHSDVILLTLAEQQAGILESIRKIEDPPTRERLGRATFDLGRQYFSAESAKIAFHQAICL